MGSRSVWCLVSAALVTLAAGSRRPPPWVTPGWLARGGRPLDLNRATAAELATLPGIGPARAAAIVRYRARCGGFARVADLMGVPSIGAATCAEVRAHVAVGPEVAAG